MSKPLALALTVPSSASRQRRIATELTLALTGAALMAVAAQVRIPWQPVPFTLQTLVMMLIGLSLGPRVGAVSLIAYLGVGLAGAPVFSGGSSGLESFLGPTGGYLASFLVVTPLLGWAAEKGWDASPLKLAAALVAGITINLGLGWAVLAGFIGPSKAFYAGVAPFILIEIGKAILVTLVLPSVVRMIRRD